MSGKVLGSLIHHSFTHSFPPTLGRQSLAPVLALKASPASAGARLAQRLSLLPGAGAVGDSDHASPLSAPALRSTNLGKQTQGQ